MKKIIINENWEEEIIEDKSSFFVLIFTQGSNAGYIKAFSTDLEEILAQYRELLKYYSDTAFESFASIFVIKVPNTLQVKDMLEKASYIGDENNEEKLEIINHLLNRADCEYLEETHLETLEEAKKKKKRKKRKTPRVTYTTGWPWYNDHMFNHHIGSCDCDKDKDEAGEDAADNANDAIGGGDSVGDAGSAGGSLGGDFGGGDSAGGEGGAIGEGLVNEAVNYYDQIPKMAMLNDGTRGFNAKAASDEKLRVNRQVCLDHHWDKALKIIEDEMIRRGLLQPTPTVKQNSNSYKKVYDPDITALDFQPADIFFIWKHKDDLNLIIKSLTGNTAHQTLFNLIIYLILAVYLKEQHVIEGLKSWIINEYNMTSAELKEIILKKALNNKEVHNRIVDCINTANSERKK